MDEIDLEESFLFEKASSLFLEADCEILKQNFFALNTRRDIAALLDIPYGILIHHLFRGSKSAQYSAFSIPKKGGGMREIKAPVTALKIMQRKLSQVLYSVYVFKPSAHGFVPGRSIVTNAEIHSKRRFILNLDLKDFFPSINFGRVRGMFLGKPYFLNEEVSTALAQICCYQNQLPQGAPTSPVISNMLCAQLDSQLQQLAKRYKCTYTRYADDITFSTTLREFPSSLAVRALNSEGKYNVALGQELISIIQNNGFQINYRKARLQDRFMRQEVTGLIVNKFPNVNRKYIRNNIRGMLHAWEKHGIILADLMYRVKYSSKIRKEKEIPPFQKVIRGRIEFVAMVRGKDDPIYNKYLSWYLRLMESEESGSL